jgi:hypothetical protein
MWCVFDAIYLADSSCMSYININKAFHASAARHAYPGRLLFCPEIL